MSNPRRPDFFIIGAMKCGTSTLQAQLAAQPGVFMTTPKEPNFFSDDDIYAKGSVWYDALFEDAERGDITGEASTHYAKLPTYPHTVDRIAAAAPDAKFIYLMRHPIDRLVSHYIHEWTMNNVSADIDDAADVSSTFVEYSLYARQLEPYIARFGNARILPLFLERMNKRPDETLARVAAFIGAEHNFSWRHDLGVKNVSQERIKRFPFYDALIESVPATRLRRAIAPKALREWVKARLQMRERPALSENKTASLTRIFNEDLAQLGAQLGVRLDCANFRETAASAPLEWAVGKH